MTKEIIIPVCLFIFTSVVGYVIRLKSKADKADVIKIIDDELKGKMNPLDEKVKDLEKICDSNKDKITSLESDNRDIKTRFEMIMSMLESIPATNEEHYKRIEKLISMQDINNKDRFKSLEKRLDK